MKKTLIIILALVMVVGFSVTAFAEGEEVETKVSIEKDREAIHLKKIELYETYYEGGLEEYLSMYEEHGSFHVQALLDREEHKAAVEAEIEAIRANVENGDITKFDGRRQILTLKKTLIDMRLEFVDVAESKAEAQQLVIAEVKTLREEMRTLLEADPVDGEAVAGVLAGSLIQYRAHIDNDILYHNVFQGISASYGY